MSVMEKYKEIASSFIEVYCNDDDDDKPFNKNHLTANWVNYMICLVELINQNIKLT